MHFKIYETGLDRMEWMIERSLLQEFMNLVVIALRRSSVTGTRNHFDMEEKGHADYSDFHSFF